MPYEIWKRRVTAKQPVCFGDKSAALQLELQGCCLLQSGTAARLYVLVDGQRFALAAADAARPHCQLRFSLAAQQEAMFSCEGEDLLLSGVVADQLSPFEPPQKKARLESVAATEQAPKAAPKEGPKAASKEAPKAAQQTASKASPKADPATKSEEAKPKSAPKSAAKGAKEEKSVAQRTLPSGLRYEVLKRGNGPQALQGKTVKVRYEGRLGSNGSRFDKGVIAFRLGMGEVIKGWDEGVKGMLKGEQRRLLVPSKLGYGASGCPPVIPPRADLVFEVELL
ncbi:unnamed protein product [Effrenium voratum]|nr:unnamed protein product [Effrenium voratum]